MPLRLPLGLPAYLPVLDRHVVPCSLTLRDVTTYIDNYFLGAQGVSYGYSGTFVIKVRPPPPG